MDLWDIKVIPVTLIAPIRKCPVFLNPIKWLVRL
jgi:hypothetical protein